MAKLPSDREHIELMAAAHRRLMRLFNPATSRDWLDEVRKQSSLLPTKEPRKKGKKQ